MLDYDMEKNAKLKRFVPLTSSLLFFPIGFYFLAKNKWISKSISWLMCGIVAIVFVEFIWHELVFYKAVIYLNAITSAFVVGFMDDVFGHKFSKFSDNGIFFRKLLMFFLRSFVVVLIAIPVSIFPLAMFFSNGGWEGVNLGYRVVDVKLVDAWIIMLAGILFYVMLMFAYFRAPLAR